MEGVISNRQLSDTLLTASGLDCRSTLKDNSPIAVGRLSFTTLNDDIQLHVSRYIEQKQSSNCTMLSPSVNITVLLRGVLEFRIGMKFYRFDASAEPIAFANIIAEPETFTRYLNRDQHIEKLTVSVTPTWVRSRFGQQVEYNLALNKVLALPLREESLTLSQTLLSAYPLTTPAKRIRCEGLTVQWLSSMLTSLFHDNLVQTAHYRLPSKEDVEVKKHKIMTLLEQDFSLEEIASQLAMSLSSLLRFFKTHFNSTPKQYIKQHRLLKARHALLIQGLSIGEAAYLAKYNHVGNFIAAFKRQFDVTPMQLIKQHRRVSN
ncbi:Transcriptional regulator, VCA0231 ortholog [Pseudoalteromonas luteoviolacea B = ATCC 29581]|nr:Transcriptional regulator, VCA0231 ortholog [Pseudoalteromonas luteoviolacea B = ATCC 29581]